ncbi:MAG TPA: MFS transporter [Thermomicrobiales bacterium]|nr:MFS transporter [Thermomicrobiales bacterium]
MSTTQEADPNASEAPAITQAPAAVTVPLGEPSSFRAVLRNGAFLRLWIAQAASQTANNIINFALLLRVREIVEIHGIEQANTAISLVILAFSLPSVLFGPIAGVVADRVNRRTLMAVVNVLRGVAVVMLLFIRPEWQVQTILVAHYLGTFLFGIAGQFFAPAQGASIPALVPRHQLMSANALFNLTFTAAQLLGFATVGPILVKLIGIDNVLALTVVVFLACAALIVTLPRIVGNTGTRAVDAAHPMARLWGDIKEGLVYILQDPTLMKAIGHLTLAATTFLMVAALGPEFITGVVGLPKEDIGYIVAPAGLGVLTGVLVVGRVSRRVERATLVDWSMTLAGIMILLTAMSRELLEIVWLNGPVPVALVTVTAGTLTALLGICNAFILVPAQTVLQERSHESIRARVYATFFTISNSVSFVPIFFAAAFADLFGVVQVLSVVGLLLAGLGVSAVLHDRSVEEARWRRPRTRYRQGPENVQSDLDDA